MIQNIKRIKDILFISLLVLILSERINCQLSRNNLSSSTFVSCSFDVSKCNLLSKSNTLLIVKFSKDLVLESFVIDYIRFSNAILYSFDQSGLTASFTSDTISITNPFSQFDTNGQFKFVSNTFSCAANIILLFKGTFQQTGSVTVSFYSGSVASNRLIGSTDTRVNPDIMPDSDLTLELQSSKEVLAEGQYKLTFKPQATPKGKINNIQMILPYTWYPDNLVSSTACENSLRSTNVSAFTSTTLQAITGFTATRNNLDINFVNISFSFTELIVTGQEIDISFKMTNPYSTQMPLTTTFLQVKVTAMYGSDGVYVSDFKSTDITATPKVFTSCSNANKSVSITCLNDSNGYDLASCQSGMKKNVKIVIFPSIFQEIYSSVKIIITNVPTQDSIPNATLDVINFINNPTVTSPMIFANPQYQLTFNKYLSGSESSNQYICSDSTGYLVITIPGFILPYDINGFYLSAQFYTYPYVLAADPFIPYQRDTTDANLKMNASCGPTQIVTLINTFSSAAVVTTDPQSLQVGFATAEHKFRVITKYTFSSRTGNIVLTFPSNISMNSGTLACVASYIDPSNSNEIALTTVSCVKSKNGPPIEVTISYTNASFFSGKGFTFTVNQIINPSLIQYSGDFSVKTQLNNVADSDQSAIGFGYNTKPAPFSLVNFSNSGGIKTVYEKSTYTLKIQSPVQMNINDEVLIIFPAYVTTIDSVTIVSPSASILISNAALPFVLTFKSIYAASSTIEISFKINNPPVTNKDYNFKNAGGQFLESNVAYGSADSITSTAFTSLTVNSDNLENLFSTAKFTINITPSILLDANSNLVLQYVAPTTTHQFFNSATTKCKYQGASITCNPNVPSINQITITLPVIIQPSTLYTIDIENVTNYLSLADFNIIATLGYSSTQKANESQKTWHNTSIPKLTSAVLTISNYNLGEVSKYTFLLSNIQPKPANGGFLILAGDYLTFTTPFTSATCDSISCNVQAGSTSTRLELNYFPNSSSTTIEIQVQNPIKLISATTIPFKIVVYELVSGVQQQIKEYANDAAPFIYQNQCNISTFCKTCLPTDKSNCQTCYSSNSIEYSDSATKVTEILLDQTLSSQKCVSTCPNNSYQTNDPIKPGCKSCDTSCFKCDTSATKCTACTGSNYLDTTNNTCNTTCPTNYYKGANNQCVLCSTVGNCQTCSDAGVCITCLPGKRKQESTCVDTCSNGYQSNPDGVSCDKCPTGCTLCTYPSICSACESSYMKYKDSCVATCPANTFRLIKDDQYYCGLCDVSCEQCLNLPTTCTKCYSETYLYERKCILSSEIPVKFYGDRSTWTVKQCMNYCEICQYGTVCDTCSSSVFKYNGICYSSCPDDTSSDGAGGCKLQYVPAAISDDNSKVVPFPMLLSCIAFSISVYFSKYEKPQTFVPGCIVGFCALFEWVSWLILVAITYLNDGLTGITTAAAIIGFVTVYLFNIISFILYRKNILPDTAFIEWELSSKNRTCKKFCIALALIFSFKIQKIIFCKYFNQLFFKAKLKDIDSFSPFNKISIFSVFLNSFLIILSSAIFSYNYQNQTQLFILSLDTLLVTMFMIIFMIWEALKNENFFEETYNMNFEQMSQFTQRFFPFDQSYMERAKQRSVYGHLKHSDSNSNLKEFGVDNKVTKYEPNQQPLNQVMDPNDMSNNVSLDRNVLQNSQNGAPYLIQDELSESSKPGKKRQFEKKHIAPVFDYKNFPPIEENSLEDEEEDYYDDYDVQNQTMKKMYNKKDSGVNRSIGQKNLNEDFDDDTNYNSKFLNASRLNQSNGLNNKDDRNKIILLDDQQDIENQKMNKSNKNGSFNKENQDLNNSNGFKNSKSNGFKNNKNNEYQTKTSNGFQNKQLDSDEPVPGKQNSNHTVFYDPQGPSGQLENVSMGVGLQDGDNEMDDGHQILSSKPSVEELQKEQAVLLNPNTAGLQSNSPVNQDNNLIPQPIIKQDNLTALDQLKEKTAENNKNNLNSVNNADQNSLNNKDQLNNANLLNSTAAAAAVADQNTSKDQTNDKDNINKSNADKDANKDQTKNSQNADKDNKKDSKGGKEDSKLNKDGKNAGKDGKNAGKDNKNAGKDGKNTSKDGKNNQKDNKNAEKDLKNGKKDTNENKLDDKNQLNKNLNNQENSNDTLKQNLEKQGQSPQNKDDLLKNDGITKNPNKDPLVSNTSQKMDKNKMSPQSSNKKSDDLMFYFNNPLEENNEKESNKEKKAGENLAVEKIMPDVQDLDVDPIKNDKNIQNDKDKKIKMNTPNDIANKPPSNDPKKKGPQKNNLFGVSDDEGDESKIYPNKKSGLKSDKKNNIYDSDESLHTASEAEMNFNEVSPTDFNILNQRYEEDYFVQPPASGQLLEQSLSQLQRNYSANQSQANMNQMRNTNQDYNNPNSSNGYNGSKGGSRIDNDRNLNSSGQNNLVKGQQSNGFRHPPLHSSNSNASMNSLNTSNVRKKSSSPVKRQVGMANSRSQNVNALSVDMKQNPNSNLNNNGQSNNGSTINSNPNNNSNLLNGNPTNQLIIENFDDFNNTSSQSQFQGINNLNNNMNSNNQYSQNQFNASFNNQDPRASYQINRGNLSSRSKGNSPSNANITYKVPAVDQNKLKNLEKIYLQRIETNVNSQQSSRKNTLKKKKKKFSRQLSQNSNLQVHQLQNMKSPADMSEIYFGGKEQQFDPTAMDNNGEDIIDFEDDEDFGPDNVNFDQNF